jgi:hypothetical protein
VFEGKYYAFDLDISDWDYFCIKEVARKLITYNRDSVISFYFIYVSFSIIFGKKLWKGSDPFLGALF